MKTFALACLALVSLLCHAASAQTVKIGVILGTTGGSAFVGVPGVNGIKLAIEELEATSYFRPLNVQWLFHDNRSDKQETATLINRLVKSEDVVLLMGPVSSAEALAAAPLANELKVPMFTAATSPEFLKAGPWAFKSTENAADFISPLAHYVADKLKPKSCFLVHIRDNDAYLLYSNIFRDVLSSKGSNIAAQDSILSTESDFTALATKIVASNADCLFLSTPPESGANIVVQAKQAGLPNSTLIIGNQNMISPGYVRTGGRAVDGTYLAAEFAATSDNKAATEFVKRYTAKYKSAPDTWAAIYYSMTMIVASAIKNAGDSPIRESLRSAMARTRNVPVVIGKGSWSLDEQRIPHFGSVILRLKDGVASPAPL